MPCLQYISAECRRKLDKIWEQNFRGCSRVCFKNSFLVATEGSRFTAHVALEQEKAFNGTGQPAGLLVEVICWQMAFGWKISKVTIRASKLANLVTIAMVPTSKSLVIGASAADTSQLWTLHEGHLSIPGRQNKALVLHDPPGLLWAKQAAITEGKRCPVVTVSTFGLSSLVKIYFLSGQNSWLPQLKIKKSITDSSVNQTKLSLHSVTSTVIDRSNNWKNTWTTAIHDASAWIHLSIHLSIIVDWINSLLVTMLINMRLEHDLFLKCKWSQIKVIARFVS